MAESPMVQLDVVDAARRTAMPVRGGFSLRDLLTVMFKRWMLATLVFVAIVGGVGAWTFLSPPVYECEASLLVKRGRAEVPVAPKDSPLLLVSQVREEDLNTEIFILRSPELLGDVVDNLQASGDWPTPSLPELTVEETVAHLETALEINGVTGSNIIHVAYRSPDPEWALAVVQEITNGYLDRRSEVFESPKAASFFGQQEQESKGRLQRAELAMQTFLRDAGLTVVRAAEGVESLASEKKLLLDRISELNGRREDAIAEVDERQQEIATLEIQLGQVPERLPSSNRLMLDSTIEELQRGLVVLQLQRDKLKQVYAPQNAKVRDVERQIELLQARITTAQGRTGDISLTEPNPLYRELRSQLVLTRTEHQRLQARATSTDDMISQHRRRLAQLNQLSVGLDRLEREKDTAEEAFLLYQRKHEEARISSAMDEERIVNVAVAQPARMPTKPAAPKKKKNMALALMVGSLAALGLAFLRERLAPTITTAHDLELHLGMAELASIPEIRIERR